MNTPPASILVVATRRIGDVLLTTPLIRSLKTGYPGARIDVLVFAGTEGVLRGNPDIHAVLTVPERPTTGESLRLLRRLFRRYDLAVSTLSGDRPTLYAWLAARYRIGFVDPHRPSRLKQGMLHRSLAFDDLNTHTVRMNLALAELLALAPVPQVVPPAIDVDDLAGRLGFDPVTEPFVVLHPYPKYAYKQWRREGWQELARWLAERGTRVVLTGGPAKDETAFVAETMRDMPATAVNVCGRLSLPQTAGVISRALAYVGPDTATTHIAAALGVPVIALFGPSNPVKWGPWPVAWTGADNPYAMTGTQLQGNVVLVQGAGDCVPCMKEGCQRHVNSMSDCLTSLSVEAVTGALLRQLEHRGVRVLSD